MKASRMIVNGSLVIALVFIATGCAVPTMNMKHEAAIGKTYPTRGNLQVDKFKDTRPGDEKVLHQTAMNKITPQIWSGNTSPEMMEFFQTTIEQEARTTKMFTLGPGEYTLSGNVSSLKVDRTCTVFRYVIGIFDFPKIEATVAYHAVLSRDGKEIMTKDITHKKSAKYWAMTEMSWAQVSNKSRKVLDDAITESFRELFDEIDQQVK